jgi:hypothetical protein
MVCPSAVGKIFSLAAIRLTPPKPATHQKLYHLLPGGIVLAEREKQLSQGKMRFIDLDEAKERIREAAR